MISEQKTEMYRSIPPVCPFTAGERVKCLGVERTITMVEAYDGAECRIHFSPVANEPDRCLWPLGGDGRTLQKIERPACPFKAGDWIEPFGGEPQQITGVAECGFPSWGYTHEVETDTGALWCVPDINVKACDPPRETAEPPQHRPDPTGTYVAELCSCLLDSIHLTRNRIRVELERCYSTRANIGPASGGTVDYGAFLAVQTLVNKLLGDLAEQANRIDELAIGEVDDAVIYGE